MSFIMQHTTHRFVILRTDKVSAASMVEGEVSGRIVAPGVQRISISRWESRPKISIQRQIQVEALGENGIQ